MNFAYRFGPFELDARSRRLLRDGHPLALGDRYIAVLLHLAARAGTVVSKNELVTAAWDEVAVTDNSLEQAISAIRRVLGPKKDGPSYVETVPRQGYRLAARVERTITPDPDATIDALLAPHRALIDGRAALETFERDKIVRARAVFTNAVAHSPHQAPTHVGLANACVLHFEMTRADEAPDTEAIHAAVRHAREACRLDAAYGEAWATLGFVLQRAGPDHYTDAVAASRRAIALEPDNWRHHVRLSSIAWGEERLRAARRTLELLPGLSMAHWLASTVLVARQTLDEAARELSAGIEAETNAGAQSRFTGVALHWLLGLVYLAQGNQSHALEEFERELAAESGGHLYARECCANTWYAIGALRLRQRRLPDAARAFEQAIARVSRHPMARLGLELAAGRSNRATPPLVFAPSAGELMESTLCRAARLAQGGDCRAAAQLVEQALAAAPPGPAAWFLRVEPLLDVAADPKAWGTALGRLCARAA